MPVERKRGFIRPDSNAAEEQQAKRWGLPDYGAESAKTAKETAMNYDPGWMPSFDEPEVEEPKPLSVEEIEQIRQAAYQEGLEQGKEEGFQTGLEQGKEAGFQSGHEEGLVAGKEEGIAAGQEHIQEQVERFVQLANQFAQPLELMNAQVEKQLVDMVLTLTKEVVHVEVKTNPQIILDTIKQSVESLPIAGHAITLKLHPDDVAIVKQAYGNQELDFRNWTLVAEPALDIGDVQIEASDSSVNYRLEERIRTVLNQFCAANRHHAGIE
ncbi:flagellar assembly protein FliH [Vibrio sp. CAIM 722]|uniref:Flagellar assembly protein FliH n=1 Tax=Vibrio eleionomae TaxID=2653505 RepID=A0A7X4RT46_9VIBR|nr:flagellar assembly protein FliH [Vibrio eleionomae]MZI92063.1 flagellar assembly protein FliH [Vibrio eleionomae]